MMKGSKAMSCLPRENEPQQLLLAYEDMEQPWLPGRPSLRVKGVDVHVVLSGYGKPVWDFGDGDQLGPIKLIALDELGHPIDTSADQLFPGDFEDDPEYKLLLRYVDVADAEAFTAFSDIPEPVREASGAIGDFVVQRPLVPNVSDAVKFEPNSCRVWRSGSSWNGVTRLGDAVADGLLSAEEYDRIVPRVKAFLRNDALEAALERALEPFPDKVELLERTVCVGACEG